jgi:predicted Zn-dependent protease
MLPGLPCLSSTDLEHVQAARGLFELGLCDDAWEELESVEPESRAAAAVLALRVEILLAKGKVDYARTVAAGAVRMHPDSARCHYVLALVELTAGNVPAGKEALRSAGSTDAEIRAQVLDDSRLAGFWESLGK